MIHEISLLTELKEDWAGIAKLVSVFKSGEGQVLFPEGVIFQQSQPPEVYNIPFLLSYGILEKALKALGKQDQWIKPKNFGNLGNLMFESKNHLNWKDFDTVNDGREARNDLAHEAILLTKEDCIRFIEAIHSELGGWGILKDTS